MPPFIFSVCFTGEGTGILNIHCTHGTLSSETYSIMDCSFYDRGTSSDYTAWTSTDFIGDYLVRGDDYTTLIPSDNFDVQYKSISANDTCFEFDVCVDFTVSTNIVSFRQNTSNRVGFSQTDLGLITGTWHHVKLLVSEGTVTPIVDGVTKTSKSWDSNINRFYLVLDNTKASSMKYKNFKVYPI